MFIRRTKAATGKDGKSYFTYRLVENRREDGKTRQRTLLNLGSNWAVPRDIWGEVTCRVEATLQGQLSLFDPPEEVETAAQDIVRRLRARGLQPQGQTGGIVTVDLDTMDHADARSVGGERLCLKALGDLQLADTLRQLGLTSSDARIALALLVAKMLHPSSERETSRWLRQDSATAELLSLDPDSRSLSRKTLYRVGDALWKHRAALEQAVFQRERQLLDIPDMIVFYDLSNTYHTGQHSDDGLLRFGRSKQRRDDCPLVTLALVLDGMGFPRSSEILPGNVAEVDTLQAAMQRLQAVHGDMAAKPTVVMDAGIASEANLAWLRQHGYGWICISKGSKPPLPERDADVSLQTSAGHEVRAWQLSGESDTELTLQVVSEGRKLTDQSILARRRERFERELRSLDEGLSRPRRMKRYDRVLEKVGRLKERYPQLARQYRIRVGKGPGKTPNATSVRVTRTGGYEAADKAAGSSVMRTSHTDWDLETVVRTYWKLTDLELTFAQLKSELGLRPIWHRLDDRISAHLFIAVLAYHAVHLIRTRLQGAGIRWQWSGIRQRLRNWVRITTTIQRTNGCQVVVRQDVRPSAEVANLSRRAGVEPQLHRVVMGTDS